MSSGTPGVQRSSIGRRHLAHHRLVILDALAVEGGHDQAALVAVGRVVDKQHPLAHQQAHAHPVHQRLDQEVLRSIHQDIAISRRAVERHAVHAEQVDAHHLAVAAVIAQREAERVAHRREQRAHQGQRGGAGGSLVAIG